MSRRRSALSDAIAWPRRFSAIGPCPSPLRPRASLPLRLYRLLAEIRLGVLVNIARGKQVGYGHPFRFAVLCIEHDCRAMVQLQLISQNDVVCAVSRITKPVSRIKMLKRP